MWKKFTTKYWQNKYGYTFTTTEKIWRVVLLIMTIVFFTLFLYRWIKFDGAFGGNINSYKDFYTAFFGMITMMFAYWYDNIRDKALERRIKELQDKENKKVE